MKVNVLFVYVTMLVHSYMDLCACVCACTMMYRGVCVCVRVCGGGPFSLLFTDNL